MVERYSMMGLFMGLSPLNAQADLMSAMPRR